MRTVRHLYLPVLVALTLFSTSATAQRGMRGGGGMAARPAGPARVGGMPMGAGRAPMRVGGMPMRGIPVGTRPVGTRPVGTRPGVVARPASMGVVPRNNRVVVGSTRNAVFFTTGRFHHHHHFFFNNCFGFGFPCNNGFFLNSGFSPFGSGLWSPFWGWGGYPYSGDYYPQQPAPEQQVESTDNSAANMQLAVEIQRLSDEVESMREQAQQEHQQAPAARPQPQGSLSAQPPAESTAFVFRDGNRINTQNYAIVGDTLWVLGQHTAKKIPLANLDKAATEQANAANGIELHLP